eukprot:4549701-Heterocapsa_arctica.AAC.1
MLSMTDAGNVSSPEAQPSEVGAIVALAGRILMSAYHLKFLSLRIEDQLGVHVADHPDQEKTQKSSPIDSWIPGR